MHTENGGDGRWERGTFDLGFGLSFGTTESNQRQVPIQISEDAFNGNQFPVSGLADIHNENKPIQKQRINYTALSYNVTVAILVFQNNVTAAMLVFQTNPVELCQ